MGCSARALNQPMLRIARNERSSLNRRSFAPAYTIVELLIVVTILGIVVGLALSRSDSSFHDQLQATAQVVVADLGYGRSLAVGNNSQYRYTFDLAGRRYWLEHTGTNPTLNNLPASPYRDSADPSTKQTTSFAKLLSLGGSVGLAAVRKVSASSQTNVTTVEFGSLGALTQVEDCWIWLAIGQGNSRRYLPVELDSTTGLAKIGTFQTTGPPAIGTP
jgi:Tfp pilus assembly protein FimT